ncbi:hypothetical protein FHW12_003132 [Dokdonella fugitiva]|uniref:Uncharacterized protein n=1 Tax=Dokdonella fugitiva TaxID=328517 RepID=A0A839F2T7_9GAMM|nr:hypothetical protein [Dokdonella fugitiva]MBA8888896.1 hypothetical protein [Dokdonella fugitiva]
MSPVERQEAIHAKLTQAAAICGLLAEHCDGDFNAASSAIAARELIFDARTLTDMGGPV